MLEMQPTDRLAADIMRRTDPDGRFPGQAFQVQGLTESALGRWLLNAVGLHPEALPAPVDDFQRLAAETARAIILFGPRGWVRSGRTGQFVRR